MSDRVAVAIETGDKRVFARALDWPGWARSGKTEADALTTLAAYAGRYGAVVAERGFPTVDGTDGLEVVERLDGGAGTDFGVPSATARADKASVDGSELARLERLLDSVWAAFERTVDGARGIELRKGPRGGGRDLDKIVGHVHESEEGYLKVLGARPPKGASADALRAVAREALRARARGDEPPNPSGTKKRWAPRYYVHRSAWHILDHAWEIEDRSI